MKILCRTLFDCSRTRTTGHFRINQLPFVDAAGQTIKNHAEWTKSRNQQRNFESIVQIMSLRAQPEIKNDPVQTDNVWEFEFEVERSGVYSKDGTLDSTSALVDECAGTPMITGLNEKTQIESFLIVQGPRQNIWFETVNI